MGAKVAISVLVALVLTSTSAFAACREVPRFESAITVPDTLNPPDPPFTSPGLERYRVLLELFRKNTVERYNSTLQRYVNTLNRLDESIRLDAERGTCDADALQSINEAMKEEYRKTREEYLDEYRRGIETYDIYMSWYKDTAKAVRYRAVFG